VSHVLQMYTFSSVESFLADNNNGRAYAIQCCVCCRLSVCLFLCLSVTQPCIVVKRCVLE